MATQHLIDHGHRRIAILVAPSYYTTGRRLRGYRKALRQSGIEADEALVVALRRGTTEEATAATHALLTSPHPPTAIFSTTGFLTEESCGRASSCRLASPWWASTTSSSPTCSPPRSRW